MDTFAHPFRFSAGKAAKIDDGSDLFAAQIVAAAVRTNSGELPINPDFGTRAGEFSHLDRAGLIYSVSTYHPDIALTSITEQVNTQTQVIELRVEFTRG